MMTVDEIMERPIPEGMTIYREGDAVIMGKPVSPDFWEVHCGASPEMRGRLAIETFRRLATRFWADHPEVVEVIGVMPPHHRAARLNCTRIGFHFDKIMPVHLNGETKDVAFYRMARP